MCVAVGVCISMAEAVKCLCAWQVHVYVLGSVCVQMHVSLGVCACIGDACMCVWHCGYACIDVCMCVCMADA